MLFGLLNSLLNGFASIFEKKTYFYVKNVSGIYVKILWLCFSLPVMYFVMHFSLDYSIDFSLLNRKIIIILLINMLLTFPTAALNQYIIRNEKLSQVMPFNNLDKIFAIIVAFFLFWNTKIITLFIALFSIVFVIFFNLDFKNIKFPKKMKLIFLLRFLFAIRSLLTASIILEISSTDVYFYINSLLVISAIIPVVFIENFSSITSLKKDFYFWRFIMALFYSAHGILGLFLIQEYGLIVGMLLSFLQVGIVLILSYFLFSDTPSKKDIFQTVFVYILVGIWFYFK